MIYLLFGALVIAVVLAGAYVSLFAGHGGGEDADLSSTRLDGADDPEAAVDASVHAQVEASVNAPSDTPATEGDP